MTKPVVLVIGGLDPQGCAGITQDTQAVAHNGGHPVAIPTCLTEQTSSGLTALGALSKQAFIGQYRCAIADFDIDAIKIGFIPNLEIALAIKAIVTELDVPVILDPVLASTSGGEIADAELITFIAEQLIPLVSLVTPNLTELMQLTGEAVDDYASVETNANRLLKTGSACLVKGGHSDSDWAADYYSDGDDHFYCYQPKLNYSVRGTGCVLAATIATHVGAKLDLRDAIVLARAYINRGIRLSEALGPYRVIQHSYDEMVLVDMPKLCYQANLIGQQFSFPKCPQRLGIYPIVDSSNWVGKLIDEGINTIQLRVKNKTEPVVKREITASIQQCTENIAFFVNDYWQLAIESGAYGVHLGQEDLHDASIEKIAKAGLRLGVSTHSYWELARALAINPSYIALGPVYETTSKKMPWIPQGVDRVSQWTKLLGDAYPLVAIGGINVERAQNLKSTRVGSVAMISAITQAVDYKKATRDLIDCWSN